MKKFGWVAGGAWFFGSLGAAQAQSRYARPPDGYWEEPSVIETSESTVRLNVGPALRSGSGAVHGGLATAVDIGAKAAGARFSGAWFGAGSDGGLAQYTAELWIDFGAGRRWRPIVATGGGVARLDTAMEGGSVRTSTVGIALLRGSLEYVLPLPGVDGRAGLDVAGAVPAIRDAAAPDTLGWITVSARVGVGF